MRNKNIVVIAVLFIVGIAYLISWFASTVSFKVEVHPDSEIKEGLVVTTSKDNHSKIHKLPYSTRVKPGEYSATAWGNGSETEIGTITVERGGANGITFLFRKSTGENFERIFSESKDFIPYKSLFPYETADYLITSKDDGEKLTEIIITAKHRFTKPSDGKAYSEERDIVVKGAKKWLSDRGVPTSIKATIIDG